MSKQFLNIPVIEGPNKTNTYPIDNRIYSILVYATSKPSTGFLKHFRDEETINIMMRDKTLKLQSGVNVVGKEVRLDY